MKFAPLPENDFREYIENYYRECRARFPAIEAIAGKWMFRDLLPGMSDYDTRFIVSNGVGCREWCEMSRIIGETHLRLSRRHPSWARNLEHLPGINLTWEELLDEKCYYPEYRQWSFYDTASPDKVVAVTAALEDRPWCLEDEYFFLKKFCLYFGRYNRTIDPAVNMGCYENRYPLHSRIMHYFVPPLQSAWILLQKKIYGGKFEALEWGAKHFRQLDGWDEINEILRCRYAGEHFYREKNLIRLEDHMERILVEAWRELRSVVTLIPESAGLDMARWKAALNAVSVNPVMKIFDSSKFCRLMKGRLYFYAHAPEVFDPTWPIQNEFARMNSNYLKVPFVTFGQLYFGRKFGDCNEVFDTMHQAGLLSFAGRETLRHFDNLTRDVPAEAETRSRALAVAEIFDGVFEILYQISSQARKML